VQIGSLRAELNCRTPGTAEQFADLAVAWLNGALRTLGAPLMAELDRSGPLSPVGLRDRSGTVPFGAPSSVWLSLVIASAGRGGRTSISPWSPQNWKKFTARLKEFPAEASAKLSVLGADGYPDVPFLTISVVRYPEQGEWTVLSCHGSTSRDAEVSEARAVRRSWASFLREHAEACEAGFGYLTDEADEAGYRTALEDALGLFPEDMLADLDRQIRGYSWITVVSPGVAEVVGGAEALSTSQAFHEISPLPGRAVWLQATEDLAEYGAEQQRRVFDALAKALPPGLPQRDRRARDRRLVYEEPAQASGR
jgi:hypothetical protein